MASDATGVSAIAERYADALYDLAEEGQALDAVGEDLKSLKALIAESDDLRKVIRSPVLPRAEQAKGLTSVLEKAGAHELTTKFVGMVASKRRLFVLPAMIDAYVNRLAAARGESAAEVTTAKPLTEKQRAALGDALKRVMGNDVTVHETVDPSLLGGLVVRVGSRLIDSSLRTKLQSLKLAMKGVG